MPSTQCCVPLCNRRGGHVFPKNPIIRRKWLVAVKRDKWAPTKASVVCGAHFKPDDYIAETYRGYSPLSKRLRRNAVPSLFSWTKVETEGSLARKERAENREKRLVLQSEHSGGGEEVAAYVDVENSSCGTEGISLDFGTQTERVGVKDEETQTSSEIILSQSFPITLDDDTVHFYTGLESYKKVLDVLYTLGPGAHCLSYIYGSVKGIDIEHEFFLVLMKLRRHSTNFELGKMFGVSESDVYNIFCTWIRFMSLQWRETNIWPSRDLVKFYSPTDFKAKYPSTRVVLDGTECPVNKPTLPLAQQATYSSYKNRNTVKVVVGSTPGGLVSFVSSAYGGSTSDRHIIERSLVPSNCDPGDSVMADKGFDVQDIFAPYDVQINIPSFFRKQNQMQTSTILSDRKVASKRVHIERIIGLGKTYKILTQPLNQSETQLSSDIVFVCFMLCNFRSCIVPTHA